MTKLPIGWHLVEVGRLVELNPKSTADPSTRVGFVPMQYLGTRFLEDLNFEERLWSEVMRAYTHFQDGDVLLAKITPCFENGKAGIARGLPNGLGAGSSEFFVCRPMPKALDSRYLLAWLSSDSFRDRGVVNMCGSVGHKRVPREILTEDKIPLAPFPEQQRIADKLDTVLARVDACRDRLARVAPLLRRFRQSVLTAATTGRLTENMEGRTAWRTEQLGSLLSDGPKNGLYRPASDYGSGIRILRIDSFHDGYVRNWDQLRRLRASPDEERQFALANGDIVINRVNSIEHLGKCALIENLSEPCLFESNMMRLRTSADLEPSFLRIVLCSPAGRAALVERAKHAVNQASINQGDVMSVLVAVPSHSEQAEILRRVETLFAFADRLENRLAAAQSAIDRLTPALLAKAFRGELVPQDPADEPAAELLKRLQAQAGQSLQRATSKRGRPAQRASA